MRHCSGEATSLPSVSERECHRPTTNAWSKKKSCRSGSCQFSARSLDHFRPPVRSAQVSGGLQYLQITADAIGGLPDTGLAAALMAALLRGLPFTQSYWDRVAGRLRTNAAASSTWFVPSDAAVNRLLSEARLRCAVLT